jgi:hypothetical protein
MNVLALALVSQLHIVIANINQYMPIYFESAVQFEIAKAAEEVSAKKAAAATHNTTQHDRSLLTTVTGQDSFGNCITVAALTTHPKMRKTCKGFWVYWELNRKQL